MWEAAKWVDWFLGIYLLSSLLETDLFILLTEFNNWKSVAEANSICYLPVPLCVKHAEFNEWHFESRPKLLIALGGMNDLNSPSEADQI